MKTFSLSALALVTLTACGGSGGTTAAPVFRDATVFVGDDRTDVRLNEAGNRIIVEAGGDARVLDVGTAAAVGSFNGGYTNTAGERTMAFVSTGDTSLASVANFQTGGSFGNSSTFRRTSDFDGPTTGTATATGDYVGILYNEGTGQQVSTYGLRGDVRMTANFGEGTVSGRVTNREYANLRTGSAFGTVTVADLVMAESAINSNGGFGGAMTGGELSTTSQTFATSDGSYKGLIGSADGTEIVGATTITHALTDDYVEIGAFATGH